MVNEKVHVSCRDVANIEKLRLRKNINWRNEKERDDLYDDFCKVNCHVNYDSGLTHLHAACKSGNYEVVKRLLENGHDPNCVALGEEDDRTPLHAAVAWGPKEIVELLLRAGAEPNATNAKIMTPLHVISMRRVDEDLAKMFIETCDKIYRTPKVRIDAKDYWFNTPLHLAMLWSNRKALETLLRCGADPNSVNNIKKTPLHFLSQDRCNGYDSGDLISRDSYGGYEPGEEGDEKERIKMVNMIFEISFESYKVQVNAQDNKGRTPLHEALEKGLVVTAMTLLERGADPNIANGEKLTPLHIVSMKYDDESLPLMISKKMHEEFEPLQVDAQDESGNTPLHVALVKNRAKLVKSLLEMGSDPYVANAEGLTPLHIACESDFFYGRSIDKFFELCSRHRARVDVRDEFGNTPLHVAFRKKHEKLIVSLLNLGFDPYVANAEGSTPLQIACKNGYFGAVSIDEFSKLSAMHEAQRVDVPDESGRTPLQYTLDSLVDALLCNRLGDYQRFKKVVIFLLHQGADPNSANKNGETLLHLVCKDRHDRYHTADDDKKLEVANFVRMLLFETCYDIRRMFLVNAQDELGNTPLHVALENGLSSTVEVLLRRGANPNIANREELTPLHVLCKKPDDVMFTFTLFETYCHIKYHPLEVNAQDKFGNTPLHFALDKKCPHLVTWLLINGSDPCVANAEGSTPLHIACKNHFFSRFSVRVFFELSKHKERINAQDKLGNTPLHYAVDSLLQATVMRGTVQPGLKDAVELLLEKGADRHLANKNEKTPLHRISRYQCDGQVSRKGETLSEVQMLFETSDEKKQPLQVNAQDNEDKAPLHKALENDQNTARKRCGSINEFGVYRGIDASAHYLPKRQR